MTGQAVISRFSTKTKVILANVLFWLLLAGFLSYAIAQTNTVEGRSWPSLFAQGLFGISLFMVPAVYFNTQVLVPQLLVKKRYYSYVGVLILCSLVWPPFPIYLDNLIDTHLFNAPPEDLDEPFDVVGMFVTFFVMVISSLANMSYRSLKQQGKVDKAEKEKLSMELNMLRNQISPHFFFNTLNNLYALALEESKETPAVILKLSEMMRYTLYDCDGSSVKLTDEISYLENYINLQLIRYRQNVDIQFEKTVANPDLEICPLVLIVFLENAFKHGVEGLEEGAFVHMKLVADEGHIHFHIANKMGPVRKLNAGEGIGLKNARKRLELVYGTGFSLEAGTQDEAYVVNLKIDLK